MRTEIYINNIKIDLKEDIPLPLTFAIADLKRPERREASYSKTIVIPGSKANNLLFSRIFDVSKSLLAVDYNPNKKADVVIYVDSLLQLRGYCKLLQVNVNQDSIEYEISVYNAIADVFTSIEGLKLQDIDLSEFNHTFDKDHQKESWNRHIQKNGVDYVNFSDDGTALLGSELTNDPEFDSNGIWYHAGAVITEYTFSSGSVNVATYSGTGNRNLYSGEVCVIGQTYRAEIVVVSGTGGFYSGSKVQDLTAGSYTIDFTAGGTRAGFVTSSATDFTVSLLSVKQLSFTYETPTGEGYVYPAIDYAGTQSLDHLLVTKLYPAVYVKQYIDKIFTKAGFTYTSSFFESEFFKRLVIPFAGDLLPLTPAAQTARKFRAEQTTAVAGGDYNYFFFQNDSTGTAFDNSNQYDSGLWTVGARGDYDIYTSFDIDITIPTTGSFFPSVYLEISTSTGQIFAQKLQPYSGSYTAGVTKTFSINIPAVNIFLEKNTIVRVKLRTFADGGSTFSIYNGVFYNTPIATPLNEGNTILMNSIIPRDVLVKDFFKSIITMFNLYLDTDPNNEKNLLIETLTDFYTPKTSEGVIKNSDFNDGLTSWYQSGTAGYNEWYNNNGYAEVAMGSSVVSYFLIQDYSFIAGKTYTIGFKVEDTTSLPYQFIVYADTEVIYSGTTAEETAVTFTPTVNRTTIQIYVQFDGAETLGNVVRVDYLTVNAGASYADSHIDWSNKLDISKPVNVKPVSQIEGKNYIFSYKPDKDYYNELYTTEFSEVYGEKRRVIDNDHVKGDKKFELVFSPTPLVGTFTNSMVIPRIVKENEDGSVSPIKSNIRILYYGGLKDAGGTWKYEGETSSTTYESGYPYAGHLDDPHSPVFDLCFEAPRRVFYQATSYTNNNLYQKYYRRFVDEIADKDSKIVTAYFNIKPIDIFKLDFSKFIFVQGLNGTSFRLNRIYDYNSISDETTKVELAKIKQGIPFQPVQIDPPKDINNPQQYGLIDGGEDLSGVGFNILNGGEDSTGDGISSSEAGIVWG